VTLSLSEIENLRRSVAMLPASSPSGLNRRKALEVLGELAAVTTERDQLLAELATLARGEATRGDLIDRRQPADIELTSSHGCAVANIEATSG
jgi:hypothetical protein